MLSVLIGTGCPIMRGARLKSARYLEGQSIDDIHFCDALSPLRSSADRNG